MEDTAGENDCEVQEEKNESSRSSARVSENACSGVSRVNRRKRLSKREKSVDCTQVHNLSLDETKKKKEETKEDHGNENDVEMTPEPEKIHQEYEKDYEKSENDNEDSDKENEGEKKQGGGIEEELESNGEGGNWSDENDDIESIYSSDSEMKNAFSKDEKPINERIKDLLSPDGSLTVKTKEGYIVKVEGMYNSCMGKRPEAESGGYMWDMGTFINLVRLRHDIKNNGYIPINAELLVDAEPKKPVKESLEEREKRVSSRQEEQINFLKNEIAAVDTIAEIRSKVSKDDPKLDEALAVIDKFNTLEVQRLMLKKHPFIVNTFVALSNYGVSSQDGGEMAEIKIQRIREKAKEILKKFEAMFHVPENESFDEHFKNEVKLFWKILGYEKKAVYSVTKDTVPEGF